MWTWEEQHLRSSCTLPKTFWWEAWLPDVIYHHLFIFFPIQNRSYAQYSFGRNQQLSPWVLMKRKFGCKDCLQKAFLDILENGCNRKQKAIPLHVNACCDKWSLSIINEISVIRYCANPGTTLANSAIDSLQYHNEICFMSENYQNTNTRIDRKVHRLNKVTS